MGILWIREAGILLIGICEEISPLLDLSNQSCARFPQAIGLSKRGCCASIQVAQTRQPVRTNCGNANRGIPPPPGGMNDAPKGVLRPPPMEVDSTVWNQLVENNPWGPVFDWERASARLLITSFARPTSGKSGGGVGRSSEGPDAMLLYHQLQCFA
jgi:hypothetical protein